MNTKLDTFLSAALFGLASFGSLAAQQPRPRPIDTLEIDLRGRPGDTPTLMLAGRLVAPSPLPGYAGQLNMNLTEAILLPLPMIPNSGRTGVTVGLPPGANLHETVPFYAQVATFGPRGPRLLRPFQVFGNRFGERLELGDPTQSPHVMPQPPEEPNVADQAPVAIHRGSQPGLLRLSVWLLGEETGATSGGRNGRILGPEAQAFVAGPEPDSSGMSDLSIISEADSRAYPRRMACRLSLTFPDGTTAQGSGAMIDAFHVITAAHCVYSHSHGGYADEIVVEPAYDIHRADPTPFGTATWTGSDPVLIWSDYVSRRRSRHDIAVIRVDRAIGGLTSWFGTGWSSSCSTYKTNNFFSGSYSAESHTGVDMYWRNGTFDSCPNKYEARFRKYAYGGESGSGYYRVTSGGNRRIHGVMAHITHTFLYGWTADVVRMSGDKYDEINDFIDDNRPSGTDLIPLGLECSSTSLVGGGSVDVDFTVLNYGMTDFTSAYGYKIVFSADSVIDSGDAVAASVVALSSSFPAYDTKIVTRSVTVPASLAPGSYYVGVLLSSSDSETSNNATLRQDMQLVNVY